MQNRKNQIGFIGRFSKEKGIMNLVNALPILFKTTNSIEVILIGGGSLFYEIKEKIRQNGYATRVHFSGWISHDKLPDCLSELKLLVLPSYTEGLPNVILEAMACYTPVLSTPVGSIPDVIADGDTGFIMKNNSPECIAENIIRALNFPELDRIVSNARRLIERKYSYKAAAERYRQLLMDDLEVKIGPEFQL
jgi:glycosyltransferase involved in cell wall biosynthesis